MTPKPDTKTNGLIRHALTMLSGALAMAQLPPEMIEQITGNVETIAAAVSALVGVYWSWKAKA